MISLSRFIRGALRVISASMLIALVSTSAWGQAGPAEDQPVRELVFRGNTTVSDAFLVRQLKLVKGVKYTRDALNADYKRMGQLGFFSNVEVTTEQIPGGVRLVYTVTENLAIGEITGVGFDSLAWSEVQTKLRLKSGRPYSAYLARLDKEQIEQSYRAEGYQFAHVRLLTREQPPNIAVRFRVDEGPLVSLDKINLSGNEYFSAKELRKQMQLQQSGWWWFSKETFDADQLQQDVIALVRYYRAKGFLDAEVALSDVTYSPDKTSMSVEIAVEEGRQYTIGKVEFVGNKLFSKDELANRLGLESGATYDEEILLAGKKKIERLYGDNARIFARVSVAQVFPDEGSEVSLVVQIKEGHRVFVERVEVRGNDVTRDTVIRRQLLLNPGDPYNVSKIRRSHRRLLSLNYFDSVSFDIADAESGGAAARDLVVEVTEKTTGAVRFAAGVTSNAGVVGEVSVTQRNFDISRWPKSWSDLIGGSGFRGAGQFFQISLQPGSEFNRFSMTFREPSLKGGPYSLGVNMAATDRQREAFDETRIGLTVSSSRRFFRDTMTVGASVGVERINIGGVSADAPRSIAEVEGNNSLATLALRWGYDKRNDPILPSSGYRLGSSVQFAGGSFSFLKNNYRASYYHTTHKTKDGRPYILTVSGRIGLSAGDVPIFARYFAGGFGSVRGYEFRSVSPREKGEVVGGDYLTLANIEYSMPLVEEYLRIVTFFDIGGAGGETRAGAGFGFRLRLPFFGPVPLALDFALPLNKKSDDDTEVFSFSLGRSF